MDIKQKRAGDLMSAEVITIAAQETLRAAAKALTRHAVHCLVVPSDEPGRCAGVITVKDLVQVLCDGESYLLDQLRVCDAMTTPSVSVQRDFLLADCLQLMRMSGVRSAPVLDGTRLVGILSFTDVLRAAAAD